MGRPGQNKKVKGGKMPTGDLKLPKTEAAVIKIPIKQLLEWRTDPPLLRKLPPETLINLTRVSLKYQAEMKNLEAKMEAEMAKIMK
jgi:hypothetical protein